MRLAQSLTLAGVVTGITALASPGCGTSGLVGGGCADGLTNCSNTCVNLQSDQHNCGSCGHVCLSGLACIRGVCGGSDEVGGAGWGGAGGAGGHYQDGSASGGDGSSSDARGDHIVEFDVQYPQGGNANAGGASSSTSEAGSSNAGTSGVGGSTAMGGSGGEGGGGGATVVDANPCVPPYNSPLQCGDCTTACPSDKPVCAPAAGTYECRPVCDPPLINCFGSCADLNSDPEHCGTCGNSCPSGACQDGTCVGVQTGDFVAICMNYRTVAGQQTTKLLGNAVFLPNLATVRILAYDEYADPLAVQQVNATIAAAADRAGQDYSITRVSTSSEVPTRLSKTNFDTFLVYEQANAPAGELSNIGSIWLKSLSSFSYVGGTIVMLDGAQGVREMTELFRSTTMFDATGEAILNPSILLNRATGTDAVASKIVSPFTCQSDTCAFETSITPDGNTTFVVTEPADDGGLARPVVVHIARTAPQP